jgi:pimeloyl-ACP methyl ester carboxylesterase
MSQFPEKKFTASAIEVNYAEGPDNGPPMVLIHGLGGRWVAWESVIRHFAKRWHVYAIDLRGHGDSGRVPGGYEFNDFPTEVIEFLRGVVGQPAFLVGASLGGITAAGICATAPELVGAAVLVDPPLYIREWFSESAFAPGFQRTLDLRNKNLNEADTAEELRKTDGLSSDDEIMGRAQALVRADPGLWAVALDGRQTESWDPDAVLSAATPPVLLMQANPDRGGALRDVEASRTVDLLPRGRHVKWDDSGHGMHREHPERFVRLVGAFFRQVERKR